MMIPLSYAQENPIKSVEIRLLKNRLHITGHFHELINENMKETLASGMSHSLNFQIDLLGTKRKIIASKTEFVLLRYNVWEKFYLIRTLTQQKNFQQSSQFESFLNDSLHFIITNIKKVPTNQQLYIVLSFSPENIPASQMSKLNSWLISDGEMRESKPALEAESGFSINLSNLLSIFLNKKDESRIFIYRSATFTIQSLKKHENITR